MTYYWSQSTTAAMGDVAARWAKEQPAGREVVPATAFLDPDLLLSVLARAMEHYGTRELRPTASVWHKHYNATLLYPVLGAMITARTALPAAAEHLSFVLSPAGFPEQLLVMKPLPERLDPAPASPDQAKVGLYRQVWHEVFTRHLSPLTEMLSQTAGVPRHTLWVNVGNLVSDLLDRLDQRADLQPASREARAAFLETASAPGGSERNPLWRSVRYDLLRLPTGLEAVRRRSACCLRYQLPGVKHCYTCPRLTPEERAQTLQDYREEKL